MKTNFMRMMGFPTLHISGSSTAAWGNSRVRVALALDNTGSMAQFNKMTALKSAAKSFLDQMQNAATQNGDVYVSIIPFAEDVSIDPAKYGNSWLRWDLFDEVKG